MKQKKNSQKSKEKYTSAISSFKDAHRLRELVQHEQLPKRWARASSLHRGLSEDEIEQLRSIAISWPDEKRIAAKVGALVFAGDVASSV